MKYCPKCGTAVADGVQFCPGCGNSFAAAATPYNPTPNYAPPTGGYNPNPGYNANAFAGTQRTRVKTDWSLLMYILLSIVTCGIYSFYFIYKLAQDVNQMCAEDGDTVGGLGAYILLSIVTCGIYSWYWLYKIQNRMNANAPRYGAMIPENGTTVLLWSVVGTLLCGIGSFIGMHIILKSANKLGRAYNARYFGGVA